MKKYLQNRFWLKLWALIGLLTLAGCAEFRYYTQAASGHWHLLRQRRSLEAVLSDPGLPPALRRQLKTAQSLRDFASTELALPDNGSYRSYSDLKRPYVVRNVFAAPPLSLEPRRWCFPLIGCVSYRGYFDTAQAEALAAKLRARGDDVWLADVPAYSTLGWFDDPLLSTFVQWPAGRLAELVFHELAHQRLYIANDTAFNESFATAVGRLGARRWLERYGTAAEQAEYEGYLQRRQAFLALVWAAREELQALYASALDPAAKQREKQHILAELRGRYDMLKTTQWDGYAGYDRWFAEDLNNAKLAALNTYTRYTAAFEKLFRQADEDFADFYRAAEALGQLSQEQRQQRLQELVAGS